MLSQLVVQQHPQGLSTRSSNDLQIPETFRRYFLEVELQVAAKDQEEFVKQAKDMLEPFHLVGLDLVASAWRTSSDPVVVINYWDLGSDANALLEAELMLPDVPGFNGFNRLIGIEQKNITLPIGISERVPVPPSAPQKKLSDSFRYLRVSTQVDSTSLPEFSARIEGYMQRFTKTNGWFLGETYYSMTGTAGKISQLWIIPSGDSLAVSKALRTAPWLLDGIARDTSFEILRATPSDPNLDPSRDPA